jgi:tetratricopeptide (TPR) repeat protein
MNKAEAFAAKINQGVKRLKEGNVSKALENFAAAQIRNPNNYLAYYYLGEALLKMLDLKQAKVMFNHAADLYATFDGGGTRRGEDLFNKPFVPGQRCRLVNFSQARLYREMGDWDEAISLLDRLTAEVEVRATEQKDKAMIARIKNLRADVAEREKAGDKPEAYRLLHDLVLQKVFSGHPMAEVFIAKRDH